MSTTNGESRRPTGRRAAIQVLGAEHVDELEQVRQFFRNYAGWLGVDLSFQNFDEEMANLPGRYAAPDGRLCSTPRSANGKGAGCVGIRQLAEGVCELKRLYVDPAFPRPWRRPRPGAGGDPRRAPDRLSQDPARHAAGDAHRGQALPRTGFRRGAGLLPDAGGRHPVPRARPRELVRGADQQPDPAPPVRLQPRLVAHDGKSIPAISKSSRTCRHRNTCGSAVPIRGCRPTRSSACCRARSSSIAMSPTSWCIPTSTACR
jgi:hypothetical protein